MYLPCENQECPHSGPKKRKPEEPKNIEAKAAPHLSSDRLNLWIGRAFSHCLIDGARLCAEWIATYYHVEWDTFDAREAP